MPDAMMQKWTRGFNLTLGFFFFGMGVAGAILPLLPATPFLLLSAFFFARSSQRWHTWLMTHPIFGPYIAAFREKRGLTIAQKKRIAIYLTLTLLLTVWLTPMWQVRLLVGCIWAGWMIALYRMRTATES
jgi:uncharacterized membrane protein YbaN (DUF454 family)